MKIQVKDAHIEEKSGIYRQGRSAGQGYTIRKQSAWVDTGKAFPVEVVIELERDQAPFPPGDYVLAPRCFYVAKFGELKVDLKHMQPVKLTAAVPATKVG